MKLRNVDSTLIAILISISFSFLPVSCSDPESQAIETSRKLIKCIEENDFVSFKETLAFNDLGQMQKTEEMIKHDISRMRELFRASKTNPLRLQLTDDYNELGQRRMIVFIDGTVSHANSEVTPHINFLFGPKSLFSYKRISGYQILYDKSDEWEFSFDENLNSRIKKF